jgi:hypothetical protein
MLWIGIFRLVADLTKTCSHASRHWFFNGFDVIGFAKTTRQFVNSSGLSLG